MRKRLYQAPILLVTNSTATGGNVSGDGSSQGSIAPEGMTFDEWWDEIAWGGENFPDADYNGDGKVDRDDYNYYIENELWKG